jgi:metallo-beta-lactamase family protein
MRFRYLQLGEQRGIGATMHVLEFWLMSLCLFRVVTDCGVGFFRGLEGSNVQYAPVSYLKDLRVDLIIITHAHMDHLGAAPRMVAEHPEAQVLMSGKALDGGLVLLQDGLRIQKRNARDLRRKFGKDVEIPVIYDDKDLEFFQNNPNMYIVNERQWLEYSDQQGNTWLIGLYDAGHDQGAMSVLVRPPDGLGFPVYLTGDISTTPQNIVDGAKIPGDAFLRLADYRLDDPNLILITEGTNGNRVQ